MRFRASRISTMTVALALTGTLGLSACSSLGSSGGDSGKTQITFLTNNDPANIASAEAAVKAFNAANSGIEVKVDSRPGGSEGDNLVKTRLSTGDMAEVFEYNSGALLQAISPTKNLTPVTDASWVSDLNPAFKDAVSTDGKVYGSPWGALTGGGMFYNTAVYKKLGLKVPTTWDEFMANNAKIKDAGIAPVEQTYGDTWTSQLILLAAFSNVAKVDPDFAKNYTENKAKFATTPAAAAGFEHLGELKKAGYLNKDFASAKFNDGLLAVADGKAAHYPMVTFAINGLIAASPKKYNDVGLFAIPGDSASESGGATVWLPSGLYIPKGVEGDKLKAAEKFQAFMASADGCKALADTAPPGGPYASTACELPADVPVATKDVETYIEEKNYSPALEFLSPVKGPSLEQITVEVGSGIKSGTDGAALYDKDVKKQAQQLGLPGW